MRVTFNSFRDESLKNLQREASNQGRLQNQIASGQRITTADQDPSVAQKILALQSENAQAQGYFRNAGAALDISRSTYSALDEVRKVSDRAGEIASSVSPLSAAESFAAYSAEVDRLLEHAVSAANQQFDGKYLLGGTKTDTPPFNVVRDVAGQITSVTYVGAAEGPALQISERSSVSPYADGASNNDVRDFLNKLVAMRDALQSKDSAALTTQRPELQDSEVAILGMLGGIGAQQRRLEMAQEAASTRYDDATARLRSSNDVDLSQAIVELTKSQTAYQAGLQTTAKIMSQSLLDYL